MLSDNIKKEYEKYGFIIIRNLISKEEAKFYRDKIDNIIDEMTKKIYQII
jgi:ectoine hydroxylase-related dioxygenase (phytanoyl-CoA dioxygenase family)